MATSTSFFAETTSWFYKALHLALIVSSAPDAALHAEILNGLAGPTLGVLVLVCVLPSIVNPVRSRVRTNALVVQAVLMMSAMHLSMRAAQHYGHAAATPLVVQLLSGHVCYSLARSCIREKEILLGAPLAAVVFGGGAVVLPVLASLAGPRAPEVHGLALVVALGAGEVCGCVVYAAAQGLHLCGLTYESVVRTLCY